MKKIMKKPSERPDLNTFLIVGNRSKIRKLERFNEIVIVLISLSVIMAAAAAFLLIENKRISGENRDLNREVKNTRDQLASMRSEKELLLARLIAAETIIKRGSKGLPAAEIEKKTEKEKDENASIEKKDSRAEKQTEEIPDKIKPERIENEKKAATAPAPKRQETETPEAENPLTIEIGNLFVSRDTGSQTLTVGFDIKNTGPPSAPISGKIAIVLKDGQENPANWLALPAMNLVAGKPQPRRSKIFRIARFKAVVFKTAYTGDPGRYQSATLFIFSDSNKLLMEKAFAVKIK